MQQTDLSLYQNKAYQPGGNGFKRLLWLYVNALIFKTSILPVNSVKLALLRLFGATVARGVVIKPCVNIKYPWNLTIGRNAWIGENVWIDSLVQIDIGANVCLSQGAMLCTGSHNYKKNTFNLVLSPITLADGVWVCAGAIVNQGVNAASHAVLTSGSVATKNLEAFSVYQGNPALKIRDRQIG